MKKSEIGVIGLGVMGEALTLNIEDKGFPVAIYNRTPERTRRFADERAKGREITPAYDIREFVNSLEEPRRILMMITAGPPVDEVIQRLTPHLARGDILMDGGNSFFKDTERRGRELAGMGLLYMGVGISGGEEGALKGPCIMAGGPEEAYKLVEPILTRIAAQLYDGPCCAYLGPAGSGHYVKMVHNGIEYAILQLIAETYDILRGALSLRIDQIREIFTRWNEGPLSSYLIEITAKVLSKIDPETGKPLVDLVLDRAGQKGTGKWASQNAMDLGVPTPTIDAAVSARNVSTYKKERIQAAEVIRGPPGEFTGDHRRLVDALHDALYCSEIVSYAQGMALLQAASKEYNYNLNLAEIARIWRGGCIIRAKLIEQMKAAYQRRPDLPNLLMDAQFASILNELQDDWRLAVQTAKTLGIPCPSMNASLDYFDSYRRKTLPANLIQALRDCFGAHGYERVDKPGTFHTEWRRA